MSIKGQLTKAETNQWGFTTIWVSGTRYGSDKKGTYPAQVGDIVEFEAYEKAGNDGRTWPTVKFASLRKVAATLVDTGNNAGANSGTPSRGAPQVAQSKDGYWSEKEANDKAKDPRISYQASYERAILITDLAIRNGAFDALAKAKPTARLEILQAFVAEQADKIMGLVYSAKVPSDKAQPKAEEAEQEADEAETAESWS